jgi:hypothetical protein
MPTLVLIAVVAAALYGLSKIFFPSSGRAAAAAAVAETNAKGDAMVASWRHDYVGKVYEGDRGRGVPERIVIADVGLGQAGPIIGVAFNPQMVDGKLVYGQVYHYSISSFAQFATWSEVQP